ncbi:MAG TPA: CRISPR-associated endonuclease Cas2 [Roseiflexaceae bacterium]|jgi:CRISPR-associated protein Cas2|nr:CRISPR-associated endonuclease Cas2 [Roseiflexaceae bacterium]
MFTLISYDVVNDKRRTQVLKLLKGYGTHVQYSVFECDLTAQQLATIQREIRTLIDLHTDSVRVYQLDQAGVKRVQVLGIGQVTVEPLYYLVGGRK